MNEPMILTEQTIEHAFVRPCVVRGDDQRKAMFHQFAQRSYVVEPSLMIGGAPGGQMSYPVAIVEYPDGQVDEVDVMMIRFTDGDSLPKSNADRGESAADISKWIVDYLHQAEEDAFASYNSDKSEKNFGHWQQAVHLAAHIPLKYVALAATISEEAADDND